MNAPTRKTILIVDNDPDVLSVVTARLRPMGFDCYTASSGAQALAVFNEMEPDLIISDLNMPQGDGTVLAKNIRRHSDAPIILISGFRGEFRKQLRAIPNVAFLHKPFETTALLDLVEATFALQTDDDVSQQAA
ncbi:MAG: response regulator [Phycisphaerales bacterium JB041]